MSGNDRIDIAKSRENRMSDSNEGKLQTVPNNVPAKTSRTLQLGQMDSIDLTGLTDSQIEELKMRHVGVMLDLKKKATEMQLDVGALDASLSSFNKQAENATKAGYSATIQHSQSSSIGRTEVIIGNTEKAASGKLSLSAAGESSNLLRIVIVIAVALVLIALFIGKH